MTFGSLFSGIGGLDLGLEWAGMKCKWQSEIEPYPSGVLKTKFPGVPNYGDITQIDWSTVEPVDLVCGGFPCQPHSVAGKRKGSADERNLWPEYVRCLREIAPAWVLAENVRGLLSSDGGRMFPIILRDLACIGYDAWWIVLRASDFGAPHRRERVFVVAYRASEHRGVHERRGREGQRAVITGRGSAELGDPAGVRRQRRDEKDANECCRMPHAKQRPGELGAAVGDPGIHGGRAGLSQSSAGLRRQRSTDAGGALANTSDGQFPQPRRGSQGRDVAGSASAVFSDAKIQGLENRIKRQPVSKSAVARFVEGLSGFPPGPANITAWQRVLREQPWLAPAISKEETQSLFCGMADGLPDPLDARTSRLKALSNAVVPQVAQFLGEIILETERRVGI